jgi:hypothetical protein
MSILGYGQARVDVGHTTQGRYPHTQQGIY